MMKNGYVWSVLFGGVLGATSVYVLTTDRGIKWREGFIEKINQLDGSSIKNVLKETSKEWAEFGDVIKVKTRSTRYL